MEHHSYHNLFERRTFIKSKVPAVKWFKKWVPQDVVTTGGKCLVMKWVTEAQLNAMREKSKTVDEAVEPEPEPTTEVLFLCSYEGCGKTFIDAGALRKHSHVHVERQYVCHYPNCGKKFLDSSKLKRHFLIHTGERDFICPHEGCGKAFSLDFNLKSHMKTHSQENYHVCPYRECGKRYTHEYKLKKHVMSHHGKTNNNMMVEAPLKYIQIQPAEKPPPKPTKASTSCAVASSNRPYACPYERCQKAYIHEYKLNLHLKREHPGHFPEENPKNAYENEMDAGSDRDGHWVKSQKQNQPKPNVKLPPAKVIQRKASVANAPVVTSVIKNQQPWPVVRDMHEEEDSEDSEETEEDRDNGEERWGYGRNNIDEDDDEETEYED